MPNGSSCRSSEYHARETQSVSAISDMHISEVLTRTRRRELEAALSKAENSTDVIIQSRLKRKQSKSTRGSQFRGVSKNGKKWQVKISINSNVSCRFNSWEILRSTTLVQSLLNPRQPGFMTNMPFLPMDSVQKPISPIPHLR
jgi:hypothetical protein